MARPKLTVEELRGMMVELGLTGLSAPEIAAISEAINADAAGALDALVEHFVGALGANPLPEAIASARTLAESHARDMLLDMTKSTLSTIGDGIAKGIEQGLGPRDIARRLDVVRGLDSVRAGRMDKYSAYLDGLNLSAKEWEARWEAQFQRELADRKLTIARTEQARATGDATRANAEGRGSQFKAWITAGDDRVSDECEGNEAEGWIPIENEFSGGVDQEPQHPNCRCKVAYRTAEPSEREQERAQARAARTEDAKAQAAAMADA